MGVSGIAHLNRPPPPDASSGLDGRLEFLACIVLARLNRRRIFLPPQGGGVPNRKCRNGERGFADRPTILGVADAAYKLFAIIQAISLALEGKDSVKMHQSWLCWCLAE
jgi:hypothetical protein